METREFVYGVEEDPGWFKNYTEKIEVNHRGIMTCYIYNPHDKNDCRAKIFRVNDVITYSSLYDLW